MRVPQNVLLQIRCAQGERLSRQGRFSDAIRELEAALDIARRARSAAWRARCCNLLADLHHQLGDAALGDQMRQLAIAAEMEADRAVSPAGWMRDRGAQALAGGSIGEAERWIRGACRIERAQGCVSPDSLCRLAEVHQRRGRSVTARRTLRRALKVLTRRGDGAFAASVWLRLGHWNRTAGRWRSAGQCFRRAATLLASSVGHDDAVQAVRRLELTMYRLQSDSRWN